MQPALCTLAFIWMAVLPQHTASSFSFPKPSFRVPVHVPVRAPLRRISNVLRDTLDEDRDEIFVTPITLSKLPLSDPPEDDGEISSDIPVVHMAKDPLKNLLLNIDRQRQMHRLAATYFKSRQFLLLFLPSIAITMVSGILAFLASAATDVISPYSGIMRILNPGAVLKRVFTNSVGILSVLSIFMQSLMKELDWSHRHKEHEKLAVDLRTLSEDLVFDKVRLEQVPDSEDDLKETVFQYQSKYNQAVENCSSPLPQQIVNGFELCETRLKFRLMPPVLETSSEEPDTKTIYDKTELKVDWAGLMMGVNDELYNEYCSYRLWPVSIAKGEVMAENTLKKVAEMYLKDQQIYSPDSKSMNLQGLIFNQHKLVKDLNAGVQ